MVDERDQAAAVSRFLGASFCTPFLKAHPREPSGTSSARSTRRPRPSATCRNLRAIARPRGPRPDDLRHILAQPHGGTCRLARVSGTAGASKGTWSRAAPACRMVAGLGELRQPRSQSDVHSAAPRSSPATARRPSQRAPGCRNPSSRKRRRAGSERWPRVARRNLSLLVAQRSLSRSARSWAGTSARPLPFSLCAYHLNVSSRAGRGGPRPASGGDP